MFGICGPIFCTRMSSGTCWWLSSMNPLHTSAGLTPSHTTRSKNSLVSTRPVFFPRSSGCPITLGRLAAMTSMKLSSSNWFLNPVFIWFLLCNDTQYLGISILSHVLPMRRCRASPSSTSPHPVPYALGLSCLKHDLHMQVFQACQLQTSYLGLFSS